MHLDRLAVKDWVRDLKDAVRAMSAARPSRGGGLQPTWKRGSGRWVLEAFIWCNAPLMLHNEPAPMTAFRENGRRGKAM